MVHAATPQRHLLALLSAVAAALIRHHSGRTLLPLLLILPFAMLYWPGHQATAGSGRKRAHVVPGTADAGIVWVLVFGAQLLLVQQAALSGSSTAASSPSATFVSREETLIAFITLYSCYIAWFVTNMLNQDAISMSTAFAVTCSSATLLFLLTELAVLPTVLALGFVVSYMLFFHMMRCSVQEGTTTQQPDPSLADREEPKGPPAGTDTNKSNTKLSGNSKKTTAAATSKAPEGSLQDNSQEHGRLSLGLPIEECSLLAPLVGLFAVVSLRHHLGLHFQGYRAQVVFSGVTPSTLRSARAGLWSSGNYFEYFFFDELLRAFGFTGSETGSAVSEADIVGVIANRSSGDIFYHPLFRDEILAIVADAHLLVLINAVILFYFCRKIQSLVASISAPGAGPGAHRTQRQQPQGTRASGAARSKRSYSWITWPVAFFVMVSVYAVALYYFIPIYVQGDHDAPQPGDPVRPFAPKEEKKGVPHQYYALGNRRALLLLRVIFSVPGIPPVASSPPYVPFFDASVGGVIGDIVQRPFWYLVFWFSVIPMFSFVIHKLLIRSVIERRKLFHLLAFAVFVPIGIINPPFLALSCGIASALMIQLESFRLFCLPSGAKGAAALTELLAQHTDEREGGGGSAGGKLPQETMRVIRSHVYLLVGIAIPFWLVLRCPSCGLGSPSSVLPLIACGATLLGVGDAAAAFFGRRWGSTTWGFVFRNFQNTSVPDQVSKRTVVGTCAGILCSCVVVAVYAIGCQLLGHPVSQGAVWGSVCACVVAMMAEAVSEGSIADNIVLPVVAYGVTAFVAA